MNPAARRVEIVNIIRERDRVAVDELAESLHISRETVRRDLTVLARAGKIQKFHGGAALPTVVGEGSFQERMRENVKAKVGIATRALELISPGETLFIDTGSTTLYFAEQLTSIANLTVVTNSAEIARILSSEGSRSRTFLLGGEFSSDNQQTVGSLAISQIRSFRAHHAVLTIGALDERTGAMDFNIEEAQIARAMINQAQTLTLLVDSSKFNRIASFKVCGLEQINNLVCDTPPSGNLGKALAKVGVAVFSSTRTKS